MAYKGEDIKFTLQGDKNINLVDLDFAVLVYQQNDCCAPENVVTLHKLNDFKRIGATNAYEGKISYLITKDMVEGKYNMELLLIHTTADENGETISEERSVFKKKNVFTLECSASKDYIDVSRN